MKNENIINDIETFKTNIAYLRDDIRGFKNNMTFM